MYSHLSNSRGGGNKQRGVEKVVKSLNKIHNELQKINKRGGGKYKNNKGDPSFIRKVRVL